MPGVSVPRGLAVAAVLGAAAVGMGSAGVSGASPRTAAAAVTPPATVTAGRITRRKGTLAPGAAVRSSAVTGQRVFTDARHGFALASVCQADYPVASTNRGSTWRTDGPALHLHAAQAPLAVSAIGAASRQTVFAWGGGQVIDATGDGGKHWYSALFTDGTPVAVARSLNGHLVAFVGTPAGTVTWQYVSRDRGRTWHLQGTMAG